MPARKPSIAALEAKLAECKAKLKEAEYWLGIYRDETPRLQEDLADCKSKLAEALKGQSLAESP